MEIIIDGKIIDEQNAHIFFKPGKENFVALSKITQMRKLRDGYHSSMSKMPIFFLNRERNILSLMLFQDKTFMPQTNR